MDQRIAMNPNRLVQYLQKPAAEFTRADIIRYCEENQIEFVNFHYCGWDGKLKTLNFVIHSLEHLENILTAGERVDGSSLFPFIEAGKSDLYVVPKYKTAFRNPFTETPTLDILCSFYNRDGEPFESSPEQRPVGAMAGAGEKRGSHAADLGRDPGQRHEGWRCVSCAMERQGGHGQD